MGKSECTRGDERRREERKRRGNTTYHSTQHCSQQANETALQSRRQVRVAMGSERGWERHAGDVMLGRWWGGGGLAWLAWPLLAGPGKVIDSVVHIVGSMWGHGVQ